MYVYINTTYKSCVCSPSPSPQPQPTAPAHSPQPELCHPPAFLARIPLKSFLHSTILMQSLPYSGLSRPFPRNPYLTRPLYVFVIYFWPKSLAYSTPLTQSLPYSGLNRPFPRNPYLTRPLYVLYSAIVMKSFFYSLFSEASALVEYTTTPGNYPELPGMPTKL